MLSSPCGALRVEVKESVETVISFAIDEDLLVPYTDCQDRASGPLRRELKPISLREERLSMEFIRKVDPVTERMGRYHTITLQVDEVELVILKGLLINRREASADNDAGVLPDEVLADPMLL